MCNALSYESACMRQSALMWHALDTGVASTTYWACCTSYLSHRKLPQTWASAYNKLPVAPAPPCSPALALSAHLPTPSQPLLLLAVHPPPCIPSHPIQPASASWRAHPPGHPFRTPTGPAPLLPLLPPGLCLLPAHRPSAPSSPHEFIHQCHRHVHITNLVQLLHFCHPSPTTIAGRLQLLGRR